MKPQTKSKEMLHEVNGTKVIAVNPEAAKRKLEEQQKHKKSILKH